MAQSPHAFRFTLLLTGAAVLVWGAAVGCSSSSTPAGTTGTGGSTTTASTAVSSSAAGGTSGTHAEPPAAGPQKAADGTGSTTFAVTKLFLGDSDRAGVVSSSAWKQYGYDLDGKISTGASTDLCKPRTGATKNDVYPDGNDGIDNAFGKKILGILLAISPDAPTKLNGDLASGKMGLLLDLQKLGTGADYNPLLARFYSGAAVTADANGMAPTVRPVQPESLTNTTDVTSAKVQFPAGYVTGNTWVSGAKNTITLTFNISGAVLNLTIASAQIAMDMAADHQSAKNGTIAGVIGTDLLKAALKKAAGSFDKNLCSGQTIDTILQNVDDASDIMQDGSQDPSQTCDGISIGLGFEAGVVTLGGIGSPQAPSTDPCAGTTATSTSASSSASSGGAH